jgi:hypothetical protein
VILGISSSTRVVRGVAFFCGETTRAAFPRLGLRVVVPEAAATLEVAGPIADFRRGIFEGDVCGIGRGAVAGFSEER